MARPPREKPGLLDTELDGLPPELRWREWMARVEAVIFAAAAPVPRDVLARVVGRDCSIDMLVDDVRDSLSGRPYEIVAVAGGWQFRTRPRLAAVVRAAFGAVAADTSMTDAEILVLASIAYHQPVTRAALSDIAGREIGRDVIGRLRELGFIASGPRAPRPGAPYTYVTTGRFLEHFGLDTLGDLPDLEALEDAGLATAEAPAGGDAPTPET